MYLQPLKPPDAAEKEMRMVMSVCQPIKSGISSYLLGKFRALINSEKVKVKDLLLQDKNFQPSKATLRILPEQAPLHGKTPFLEQMKYPPEKPSDPPRALRGLARIVDGGLCHRCGTCIGICPTGVLGLSESDYPLVQNLSACTDCDLCVKVCPGDEFDFHEAHKEKFSNEGNIEDTHGEFSTAVLAHSNASDTRDAATSGGFITALLLHLLEEGKIDGALLVASDDKKLWKGKPIVARTADEIRSAAKSKYAITPTNASFAEVRATPGRYALVGLPCQIHGYARAAALDDRIKERIVLTIGLFCHAAIEHDAFEIIWDSLGEKKEEAKKFISRIGKHPGAPHIELKDGSLYPVYFGHKKGYQPTSMEMINILYRLYTPQRCLTCFDGLSEFADIAVGDPWMAPPQDDIDFKDGWSFALLRSERGRAAYQSILDSKKISERDVTRSEALKCNAHMASEKRWRAFRIIETLRRQGRAIPTYGGPDFIAPGQSGLQFLKTERNMLSHIFCFLPSWRAATLKFFLGNGGYYLLYLNSKRRNFKFWCRDTKARLRRKWSGRR